MPTLVTQYSLEEFRALVMQCFKEAMTEILEERKAEPERKFMTISEAAEYLNLAKPTVYTFTAKGTIPFIKKGKKLYFKKDDLDAWLMGDWIKRVHEIGKKGNGVLIKKRKK